MAAKIRKGDRVVVLAGKYRGVEGEVLQVMPKDERVLVRGVNVIKKHQRQTQTERGGIISREAPIHISNVALLVGGERVRVGFKILDDGRKVRIARKSGEVIDV
ncbi:MAG: 50S ribosomal protein L24 [Alphaproteobacteria bacterium]|nr:50S ribosomal protein L24 [Alphaproteobacteria bacterium]